MQPKDLTEPFYEKFGQVPQACASAPGTVHLMGEQVEFTQGHVLGFAIPQRVMVGVSNRDDHTVAAYTTMGKEMKKCSLSSLRYRKEDRWSNMVKGVIAGLDNLGWPLSGVNVYIDSSIPVARGMGSSSAICLAMVMALCELKGFRLSAPQAIYVAFTAETQFMGKPGRLSSLYIAMHANTGAVLAIDMRSLEFRNLRFFHPGFHFLFCDSSVSLSGVMSDYQERKETYENLREYLRAQCGRKDCRDIDGDDLKNAVSSLPEDKRRICLHAHKEEERIHQAVDVLESGQIRFLGKLMQKSHESLRDLYDVSCPEIDWLVKHGVHGGTVLGGRLSGPGFGGGCLLLVEGPATEAEGRIAGLAEEYEHIFGMKPAYFRAAPSPGARIERAGR